MQTVLLFLSAFVLVTNAICGDSVIDWGELCDDGGTSPGDGCTAECWCETPEVNVTVIESTTQGCRIGDLLNVTFQVTVSPWAHLSAADCYTDTNQQPAQCNASGYCTCSVHIDEGDFSPTTSTWGSTYIGAEALGVSNFSCAYGNYGWVDTPWERGCGWCRNNSDCAEDGCANFTCDTATGYCHMEASTLEVTLGDVCDISFCVAKQCSPASERSGKACVADADCPLGACVTSTCVGGAGDGMPCYVVEASKRKRLPGNLDQAYLFACSNGGGVCTPTDNAEESSEPAVHNLCDDGNPCTADQCQPESPFNQMCRHTTKPCDDSGSESTTPIIAAGVVLGAVALALLGFGIAAPRLVR